MKKYDYLIVGSGLAGAVVAYRLRQQNKSCLVIDKRPHLGGGVYCENINGITVHKYGAHIFHTDDEEVWNFLNKFVSFNTYRHTILAYTEDKFYNLPFNMNTFSKMWGYYRPEQIKNKIESQQKEIPEVPTNLEEQAIKNVGKDAYRLFVKEYTEKQWHKKCTELSPDIINRMPVRYTYDNICFSERYQGIPNEGYNILIEKLLEGCDIILDCDYFNNREYFNNISEKIIYTGKIDEYYNYQFGELEYRTLKFSSKELNEYNYQGLAIVNYTDNTVDYTRIIEHKHFLCLTNEDIYKDKFTIITYEYPKDYNKENDREFPPYYPINTKSNTELYLRYKELADADKKTIFVGRLAEYKYYDMDDVIKRALTIKLD